MPQSKLMNLAQMSTAGKAALGVSLLAAAVLGYFAYQALSAPDQVTKRTIVETPRQEQREPEVIKPSEEVFSDSIDSKDQLAIYPADDENVPVVEDQEQLVVDQQVTRPGNSGNQGGGNQGNGQRPGQPAPPTPEILSGPSGTIRDRQPQFTFTGQGQLYCSLNRPAFRQAQPCSSPKVFENLGNRRYVFRLWSVVDGRHSPAAARSFTVKIKPPAGAQIISSPKSWTNNPVASFRFRAKKGNLGFLCSLDGANYRRCSSPFTVGPLTDGRHVFRLKTVDAVGNRSRATKQRVFHIDTVAPEAPNITSAPPASGSGDSAQFIFQGSEDDLRFSCALAPDGQSAVFVACSSPANYQDLTPGSYIFQVRAIDRAGNNSSASEYPFALDAPEPEVLRLGARYASLSGGQLGILSESGSYSSGDTGSSANESQAITLEINPAIEVISVAADNDTVAPQAGGDAGATDDAQFQALVELRSNLVWSSSATETGDFGLAASALTITGAGDTGGSNKATASGDGLQQYGVDFSIDISWADDASPQATPYSSTIDHDVSNSL